MPSLQIALPAHPAVPGFFFRTAVEHDLTEVFAVHGSRIVPIVPHTEDVGLSIERTNPWVSGLFNSDNDLEWPASEWDGYLAAVDRNPSNGCSIFFVDGHLPGDAPNVGSGLRVSLHVDAVPAVDGDWQVLRIILQGGRRDQPPLLVVEEPQRLEALVARIAERFNPTYAAVSPDELRVNTSWERRLRLPYPGGGLPSTREYLRGFEWLTYCPGKVLDRIGGVAGARASGAFHAVREIPGGLVALQTTPEPGQYDEDAARRVQEALAAILIPGIPDLPRTSTGRDRGGRPGIPSTTKGGSSESPTANDGGHIRDRPGGTTLSEASPEGTTVLSLQIVLPVDRSAPRRFFELVVGRGLEHAVAAGRAGIVPLVPTDRSVYLEIKRLNPWLRKPARDVNEYRVLWHPADWPEFLNSVDRHYDTGAMVAFRQGATAEDALSFSVRYDTFPAGREDWHVLGLRLIAVTEADRATLPAAVDPSIMEGVVAEIGDEFNPTFATLGPHTLRLRTGWERVLGLNMAESLSASREHLRGYDWITYCPPKLLEPVGGVAAVRASGAFHAVREAGDRLVALQATETPGQYGPDEVRRVHEALAGAVTPGEPRPGVDAMPLAYNPAGA